ncbi:hypothetical protein E8E12_000652 [Didymella heteroderae]|uniref:tetrahydrofolate synthase n=1 Tax=Didymella heteroderae TaxID=1769908 RepID=A0A9P4WGT1_9PLEO|nr:hypothetical protein E8E12_000652 [Didymella heteroderae]
MLAMKKLYTIYTKPKPGGGMTLGRREECLSSLPIIHVAGTKGKGTTCLYVESLLLQYMEETGDRFRIGCLASPHITSVRERIKLDGKKISKDLFIARYWENERVTRPSIEPKCNNDGPTPPGFPGYMTLMAIYAFIKEKVVVAIIETGIGGRDDSTNIFRSPVATGITTINLDHTATLGNTRGEIALHKAGIFKTDCPAFTVEGQDDAVLQVLRTEAQNRKTKGGLEIVPTSLLQAYEAQVTPDMPWQRGNGAIAIRLANAYLQRRGPNAAVSRSIASCLVRTELSGRNQVASEGNLKWFISIAHNEVSVEATSQWFKTEVRRSEEQRILNLLIFSHNEQRDSDGVLRHLHQTLQGDDPLAFDKAIFCSESTGLEEHKPDFADPRPSQSSSPMEKPNQRAELWSKLQRSGIATTALSVKDAMKSARVFCKLNKANILIIGSTRQAGAACYMLDEAKKNSSTSEVTSR